MDIEDARAEIAQARRLVWEARRRVSYSKLWLSGFRERFFAERNPVAIDAAIKVTRADFGNVQLLDPESGALIPFVPSCLCG